MRIFLFLILLFSSIAFSQEEVVQSIYFDFDKFNLKTGENENLIKFISTLDTSRIANIQIFGYCDDRGKDAYNFELSNKRANTVRDTLIKKGIKNKIIVTIEGKGRVLIEDDLNDKLPEVRSKNRRVDVLINFKPIVIEKLNIPGLYSTIRKDVVVGDRIYLDKLLFDRGSSRLTTTAKKELDKIAILLLRNKKIEFEIQGHVCCTPEYHKEAIDKDTRKRELSKNRAKSVFNYLSTRNIDKKRMTYNGYGNTQPLGKGSDLDRRVELVITKTE